MGLFDLPQDLGFTYHHGIQTGCHSKDMPDGSTSQMDIEALLEFTKGNPVIFRQKVLQHDNPLFRVPGGGIDLDPVTRREDHVFREFGALKHLHQRSPQILS